MKSKTVRIVILVLAVILAGAGYLVWKLNHNTAAQVVLVSSISDSYWGDEQTLEGNVTEGSTQFVDKNEGLVKKFHVKVGDQVTKGQTIVTFDTTSYQLAVDHDQADIAVLESQIAQAQADVHKYQSLLPSESAPPPREIHVPGDRKAPKTIKKVTEKTKAKGSGTDDDPYRYACSMETVVAAEFLQNLGDKTVVFEIYDGLGLLGTWTVSGKPLPTLLNRSHTETVKPTIYMDEDEIGEPEENPVDPGTGEEPSEPEENPDDPADPDTPEDPTDPDNPGNPDEPVDPVDPVEPITEDWVLGDGVVFNKDGTAIIDFSVKHYGQLATTVPDYEDGSYSYTVYPESDANGNYMYSRAELAEMVSDAVAQMKDLNLSLREAKIKLKKDQLVADTGKVKADFNGVIMEVNDPDNLEPGEHIMTVKGTVNGTVTAYLSEMRLSKIHVGDQLSVMAYESGNQFEATIREVGKEPEDGYMSWGENPNNSYYPIILEPNEQVDLNMGEWCQVSFGEGQQTSNNIYIQLAYVRDDEGGSYCYVVNEKNRLEKRYIKTGKIIWGSEIEILSGLTGEDWIAFPYGKEAYEGNKTEQVDYIW
ncbi:MAG: HlyD family efflux transporter periplasmic adaptor subunit [Dorea sp.]|nr:HlyD family efflux transporter periplasmic adaptor subunit [Dorea sp.]